MMKYSSHVGIALVIVAGTGCLAAAMPAGSDQEYLRNDHVVVDGLDYGYPGERTFDAVVRREHLIGPREIETSGSGVYREVHDIGQLYCAMRAGHRELKLQDMVDKTTDAYHARYVPVTNWDDAMLRDAVAALAAKTWCPSGHVDASVQAPPPPSIRDGAARGFASRD